MEFRDSEIGRRFPKRKALVDVSNRVVSSSISTYSRKPRAETGTKPKPRSVAVPDDGGASSIGSCQSSKVDPSRSISKVADPSANSGVRGGSVLETVIPCTRQRAKKEKGKQKAKMEARHFSCPPAKRVRIPRDEKPHQNRENRIKTSVEDDNRKGSSSVPHPKPKRTWRYMLSSDDEGQLQTMLPRQFIEEQQAYFAEVDAFQLAEEVISEDDLE